LLGKKTLGNQVKKIREIKKKSDDFFYFWADRAKQDLEGVQVAFPCNRKLVMN
jgi:hypothetical protein